MIRYLIVLLALLAVLILPASVSACNPYAVQSCYAAPVYAVVQPVQAYYAVPVVQQYYAVPVVQQVKVQQVRVQKVQQVRVQKVQQFVSPAAVNVNIDNSRRGLFGRRR